MASVALEKLKQSLRDITEKSLNSLGDRFTSESSRASAKVEVLEWFRQLTKLAIAAKAQAKHVTESERDELALLDSEELDKILTAGESDVDDERDS